MSQQLPDLIPDGIPESVAVGLLRHLEWQADSFSVVFLFADVGPTLALLEWLKRRLVLQGHLLQTFEAPSSMVADPEAWLDSLLTKWPVLALKPGSLWALMHLQGNDRLWDQARLRFLARVNERRFLLESQVKRPVVLVLPADFRDVARRTAPDLWHIRAASHVLLASRPPGRPAHANRAPSLALPGANNTASPSPKAAPEDSAGVVKAWRSAAAKGAERQAFLPLAQAAVQALLQSGRSAEAAEVAAQALALARRHAQATDATPSATSSLRDVSVSLNRVGQVAVAQGEWGPAESAYRESLEIRRALVERLGGTPESLDDMGSALYRLAGVPGTDTPALLAQARAVFERLAAAHPSVERYREALQVLRSSDNPSQPDLSP